MAWRRPGDKPLSEPVIVSFTDAYMRHSASMLNQICDGVSPSHGHSEFNKGASHYLNWWLWFGDVYAVYPVKFEDDVCRMSPFVLG